MCAIWRLVSAVVWWFEICDRNSYNFGLYDCKLSCFKTTGLWGCNRKTSLQVLSQFTLSYRCIHKLLVAGRPEQSELHKLNNNKRKAWIYRREKGALYSNTFIIKHISNLHMQMNGKAERLRLVWWSVCGDDRCGSVSIGWFIPLKDSWPTLYVANKCLYAPVNHPPHAFMIITVNGSLSVTHWHCPPEILSKMAWFTKPLEREKKISLKRRIAERALQQAYKSFFNQSALRVRLHSQTPH